VRAAALATIALALPGCLAYRGVGAGVVAGLGPGARHGPDVALYGEQYLSSPNSRLERSPFGMALGLDARAGKDFFQVSPVVAVKVAQTVGPLVPFGGIGVKAIRVEYSQSYASVGLVSPVADVGALLVLDGIGGRAGQNGEHGALLGWGIYARGFGAYDVKISSKPNEPVVGAVLGVGYVGGLE
jgi:hypothetical protein